jgi:uncharacterized protein (DUF952 family)
MTQMIYKILPVAQWHQLQTEGVLALQGLDRQDGFVHLSAAEQVAQSLAKHFSGQSHLLLLSLKTQGLEAVLRWEASRGGALFPHIYAPLRLEWVTRAVVLGHNGTDHFLPEDWQHEELT